jgi:hypothetical protein
LPCSPHPRRSLRCVLGAFLRVLNPYPALCPLPDPVPRLIRLRRPVPSPSSRPGPRLGCANRTNGFTSCFLGETVFRFSGFGKTFHESENPVSVFETGTLIRFLAGRLSGLSRRFWLNRDRATQCVRGRHTPLPHAGVLWQQSSPQPADGAADGSGLRRWAPCFSCL